MLVPHSSFFCLSGVVNCFARRTAHDYSVQMPWSLHRFQQSGQTHFVTFSCYKRLPLLTPAARVLFEEALERICKHYKLRVYGYVLMPEHVHLLISEPESKALAVALKALKQGIARKLRTGNGRFWHSPSLLRSERSKPRSIHRKAALHSPQPCQTRPVCKS
jgi:REP element-mobilizing transposase RayT